LIGVAASASSDAFAVFKSLISVDFCAATFVCLPLLLLLLTVAAFPFAVAGVFCVRFVLAVVGAVAVGVVVAAGFLAAAILDTDFDIGNRSTIASTTSISKHEN
jgi:hypothetical protein